MTRFFGYYALVVAASLSFGINASLGAGYKPIDSGVWSSNRMPTNVFWLDNDRVLFPTSEDFSYRTGDRAAIGVWRSGAKPTHYKLNARLECYRAGVLWYRQTTSSGEVSEFRGPIGQETPYGKPGGQHIVSDRDINCGYVDVAVLRSRGRRGRVLLPNHGYLDAGARDSPEMRAEDPLVYFAKQDAPGRALPIPAREFQDARYFEFRNVYLIVPRYFDAARGIGVFPWPRHLAQPLWWLKPGGDIEQTILPPGQVWNKGGSVIFVPIRNGVAVAYHGGSASGDQGLYVVRNAKSEKVLAGFVEGLSVSPDGCKLGFAHAPNFDSDLHNPNNRRTLKTLNVCT